MVCQGDRCGWLAALVSIVAFGSFAVPIKSRRCRALGGVDPLVFQTYKTSVCLCTGLAVPWMLPGHGHGTKFTLSAWGLVSGLFWVPSGVAAVYAVQHAGLAAAQGTWSSLIVLVSNVWGFGVFHEHVRSWPVAAMGLSALLAGLWGMSCASDPSYHRHPPPPDCDYARARAIDDVDTETDTVQSNECPQPQQQKQPQPQPQPHDSKEEEEKDGDSTTHHFVDETETPSTLFPHNSSQRWTKLDGRTRGLLAATFNGIWGGSVMVPMHFYPGEQGLAYAPSFAVGAATVTAVAWIVRWAFRSYCRSQDSPRNHTHMYHWRALLVPGTSAGLLWSLGNLASMWAVRELGEAVGYSVVQTSLLVSGLWGIFYFHEISGRRGKALWFASAGLTLLAMFILSRQHVRTLDTAATGGGG